VLEERQVQQEPKVLWVTQEHKVQLEVVEPQVLKER